MIILFLLTGTKLDRTVRESIRNSGIDADSYLYGLHPKMCELLINSRSDNTVKSYFNAFKRWERFISLLWTCCFASSTSARRTIP